MNAAINYLEVSLSVLEANEPINRAEGNIEQADVEAASIFHIKEGIEILKAAEQEPLASLARTP